MISVVEQYITEIFQTLPYLGDVLGVGESVEINEKKTPAYWHNSELQHINFDTHSGLCYLTLNGDVSRETIEHPLISNVEQVTEIYPIKAIFYKQANEDLNCESIFHGIVNAVKKSISGRQMQLESALNCERSVISVKSSSFNKNEIWKSISDFSMPKESDQLATIDIEVSVIGNEQCFTGEPCNASDFVFIIQSQTLCEAVSACVGTLIKLEFSGDGSDSYIKTELIGKQLYVVSTDGRLRKSADYTFNSTTGGIEFISNINPNQTIIILAQ